MTKTASPTGRTKKDTPEMQSLSAASAEAQRIINSFRPAVANPATEQDLSALEKRLVIWPWPGYKPKT